MVKPSEHTFTVSADLIRGLIDCASRCGIPRRTLVGAIKADEASRGSPSSGRYPGEYILKLWERILRISGDPIIGFRMALVAEFKTFGLLGHITPRCATVLEAFEKTARYVAVASQAAQLSVKCDATSMVIGLVLDLPSGPIQQNILLWGLTNYSLLPERLTGEPLRPRSITCTFAAPAGADVRAIASRFPFKFNARDNRIVFDPSVGDLTVPSADPELQSALARLIEQDLEALGPARSFQQGIVAVLRSMLNGTMPTLSALSARAGISQRTLQRRLAQSGTSFQALLQKVLQEVSDEHLARGNLTQSELAFLLGYSEQSAFSRAYRSWTGHPPGAVTRSS
jgi:AraC-like DNA-binding protein